MNLLFMEMHRAAKQLSDAAGRGDALMGDGGAQALVTKETKYLEYDKKQPIQLTYLLS